MSIELSPERISKMLFSRSHRVTIFGAVLQETANEPYEFRKIDLMNKLLQSNNLPLSATQSELSILGELGMIEPSIAHPETCWQRTGSPLWRIVEAAVDVWAKMPNATQH